MNLECLLAEHPLPGTLKNSVRALVLSTAVPSRYLMMQYPFCRIEELARRRLVAPTANSMRCPKTHYHGLLKWAVASFVNWTALFACRTAACLDTPTATPAGFHFCTNN